MPKQRDLVSGNRTSKRVTEPTEPTEPISGNFRIHTHMRDFMEKRSVGSVRSVPNPRFTMTVELLPDDVPGMVRLRRALKCLLRSFRVRCRRIEPVDSTRTTAGETAR